MFVTAGLRWGNFVDMALFPWAVLFGVTSATENGSSPILIEKKSGRVGLVRYLDNYRPRMSLSYLGELS